MPDIGATLREARMRQRIDISDIEAQTKIRAKYLRALENEEWDLLPGPTFVKSFLRTYADALELDSRALLEEYRMRYERLSERELMPIAPQTARDRERAASRGGRASVKRDVLVAALVVGIVALLIVLGRGGDDGTPPRRSAADGAATRADDDDAQPHRPDGRRRRARFASACMPTGQVFVCLKAGGQAADRQGRR